MKVGPKEQRQRLLGPTGIERQYGSSLKAGYSEAKPVTKLAVTRLRKSVTAVHKSTDVDKPVDTLVDTVDRPVHRPVDTPVDSVDSVDRRKAYKREWMRKQRAAAKAKIAT
jgi:hypothetical protein